LKTQNNKNKKNKGSTLVEALISMAILAFVFVSILGAFSQQQMSTRKNSDKNAAILLAEQRMEELLKFNAMQLTEEMFQDYIVYRSDKFQYFDTDPGEKRQFRRTTRISLDFLKTMATIRVEVEYGMKDGSYPFKVVLSTRRGSK